MKLALITDTHWGVRNDHSAFIDHFKKFYEGVFFPILKERGIDTVIMLGDTFDRRKYTNHITIKAAREIYFDKLLENNISTTVIIGNHDTFFRNTLATNSVSLLLSDYPNISIIDRPQSKNFDGLDIALVPWICDDNKEECVEFMNTTSAQVCMGHFEIAGFEMYRGQPCLDGVIMDTFERFDLAFSGHYHHRSTKRNITYLGVPYEMTWHDYDDPKGFHIFDTDTRTLEFIQNPHSLFVRIEYNDLKEDPDVDTLSKTYVKLIVVNKSDYARFEKFVDRLYAVGPHDVKIIENMNDVGEVQDIEEFKDTLSILERHIDSMENANRLAIKDCVKSLYLEAITLESVGGL